MPERTSPRTITTFFLVTTVLALNAYIYASDAANASQVMPHVYYGVLIIAGLYAGGLGQYLLLVLTSVANIVDAMLFVHPPVFFAAITLFPFVGLFILRTIDSLQQARERVDSSLTKLDASYKMLENRVLELSALFDISDAAGATLDLEILFQEIMRVLADKLGMYRGTLSLWDKKSQILRVEAAYGLTESEKRRGEYAIGEGLTGRVIATGQPIAVRNVGGEAMFLNRMGARELRKNEIAFLCVPVQLEEEILGTLSVDKASDRFSLEDDLRILSIVASVVAQAVKINEMVASRVTSARLIAIGKMATTVAHEVRNPLGGIRGAAQLLESEIPPDSKGQEYIEVVLAEVDRLNTVIETLLSFQKPQQLNLQPHNLEELLHQVIRMHSLTFAEQGIEWQIDVEAILPSVRLDGDQCTQVFHNFIRNAIEAMPDGGKLNVRAELDGASVRIDFQDTGTGIPEDAYRRIFDPFYTTKPKGTGLGLAISQQIIHEHQGHIECISSPGKGTCFSITLPLIEPTTPQNPEETPPPLP